MANRKRKRTPRPGTATAPGATPLPESAGAVPGDKSREARREAERRRRKAENAAARAADRDVALDSAELGADATAEPAFFFGFTVSRAKLAFARFWIFGLLAVDAFLQLRHAPRYGAGGFNVAHVGFLDDLAPSRVAAGVIHIMLAYLLGAIALGVGSRLTVALAAVLYAWVYFTSQLDSYQHHYLVALVLALAVAVPWFRPRDVPRAEAARPVRSWALRVILIQIGILYLWAAIAKLDASWLDGSALAAQLGPGRVRSMIDAVGFTTAAWMIVLLELFLAIAIWNRKLWKLALGPGLALHIGIAFTNLEIGLFAWLMVALYLLIIPDPWFVAVWRRISPAARLDRLDDRLARVPAIAGALVLVGLALPFAIGVPLAGAMVAALVAGIAIVAADALRTRRRVPRPDAGIALIAVAGLLAVLTAKTTVIPEYYRFWGGASRRLGDLDTARHAYARAAELSPDEPGNHYQVGRLLLAPGPHHDEARGLAELRRAQALEPHRARALIAEARYLSAAGRPDEALARARAAIVAEPTSGEARGLVQALEQGQVERPDPRPSESPDDEPVR